VPAFWVVEHLDVFEHIGPGILPSAVDLSLDPFMLQQLKKALSHRVVMAVIASTHASTHVVGFQKALPVAAAELTALI
jgi:hypothetical protein